METYFDYSPEVKKALAEHKPVVALESTLITHGFSFPKNLEVAQMAEESLRKQNVVPATIAVMEGKIKIGLTADELHTLVQDKKAFKASKRDIPYVLSRKLNAGTTVAATLFCAEYAGIRVFATGGIGGVHRGEAGDISADLIELTKTSMMTVCAGAKSILDLGKTLEFLETHSVIVIGYKTKTFPAFFSATSPFPLPTSTNDIDTIVNAVKIQWQLGLPASILIVNPIPQKYEIPYEKVEAMMESAIQQADKAKVQGKDITPFLLEQLDKLTKGKSVEANIQLIKNNVELAGQLAKAVYEEKQVVKSKG